MSGSLLDELAGVGEVELRGGFTIDPEKAREKLRQYQLAEPQRYVLLLVEAGFSSGAERLEFEIDADDLHLRFAGETFSEAQLENIYGSLFRSSETEVRPEDLTRLRGLQQLAFALNSAMALNPRFARIESVGPEGQGTALELRPDKPDEVAALDDAEPGNWIHVKERFRPGLLVEFFGRTFGGEFREVALLREHCRWSRQVVIVNGVEISGQLLPPEAQTEPDGFDPQWSRAAIRDGQQSVGHAFLVVGRPGSSIRGWGQAKAYLCSQGVLAEVCELDQCVPGLVAVVDSPRFGKDVSQTKLVHDSGYEAVLDQIRAAEAELMVELAAARGRDELPSWSDPLLREWVVRHRQRKGRGFHSALKDPVYAAIAEAPIWPVVGAAPVSTRELIETKGRLRYTRGRFGFAPVDVPFVLAVVDEDTWAALSALFDHRLSDYTKTLEREDERQRLRLEFMTRRHLPELGEGYYLVREPIHATCTGGEEHEQGPIRGELGLRSLGFQDGWVRLVTEGCLLRELSIEEPVTGLSIVVQGPFEPSAAYDDARPSTSLAVALAASLAALERALARLAASGSVGPGGVELRALLRHYIARASSEEFVLDFLRQVGFERSEARRALRGLDRKVEPDLAEALRPRWSLGPRGDADGPAHPLEQVGLYEQAGPGPARSLAELAEWVAADQHIAWLEIDPSTRVLPELDREVLILTKSDRQALRRLLGDDSLRPYAERLAYLQRKRAFMARSVVEPRLPSDIHAQVGIEAEGIRGELGLRRYDFDEVDEGELEVEVYVEGRRLCSVELDVPLPGLVAWVDIDGESLELSTDFEGLRNPTQLRALLIPAIAELAGRLADEAREGQGPLSRQLRWFLVMAAAVVLRLGGLVRVVVDLGRELEPDALFAELDVLLMLLEDYPARDLDRAIGRLRGKNQALRAEAIEAALRRPSRRVSALERELTRLRRALLPVARELYDLALFRRGPSRARALSLEALVGQLGAQSPICWVSEGFVLEHWPEVDFTILMFDPVELRVLETLFGETSLELVADWLVGRASFERRKTTSDIKVPRGSALIGMTIDEPGVRGELGVSRHSPREVTRTRVRVFVEARQLTIVDLPAQPLALVGALEFEGLELDASHSELSSEARNEVRRFVEGQADRLIEALALGYPELSRENKARAAEIVRHLLDSWPPGHGPYHARARNNRELFETLAQLPVFAGARKPWSASELADASARAKLLTLEYRRPSLELPDGPVLLVNEFVESTLRTLFGDLRSLERELERERVIRQRQAKAEPLPTHAPEGALAVLELDGEGLEGKLWLPAERAQVAFGCSELVVERRTYGGLCPVSGTVWGQDLDVVNNWSRVVVTRAQERMLERKASELYHQLVDAFLAQTAAGVPARGPEHAAFVATRTELEGLFLRLHDSFGRRRSGKRRKRKRKRNKSKARKGNRYERLYARTRELALLELNDGSFISADTAERERPIELASLELWTGLSAEELAHQRAVERREAERAREREREAARERAAQRRREQAMREAEAAARKREAKRRRDEAERARATSGESEAKPDEPKHSRRTKDKPRPASKKGKKGKKTEPTPELLLLTALRDELRLVRADKRGLVSNPHLETLRIDEPRPRGPLFRHEDGLSYINPGHGFVETVLASYLDDPSLLSLLASSVYTYLNLIHVEIEDTHEAEFLRRHAAHIQTREPR